MTNVNGIHPPLAPQAIDAVAPAAAAAKPAQAENLADVVEISTVARLAAKVQDLPDIRWELVERIKAEIASGTYETSEKLDIAVSRLMEELSPDS